MLTGYIAAVKIKSEAPYTKGHHSTQTFSHQFDFNKTLIFCNFNIIARKNFFCPQSFHLVFNAELLKIQPFRFAYVFQFKHN